MRLLLAAALGFLSSVQVFAQETLPVRSIVSRQPVTPIQPPLIPLPIHTALSTQGVEGGFWHTDGNYDPILRIKNILLKQPLDVTPSIFLADGTEYRMPVVHLEAAGITQINVRYALQDAPANIRAHMSQYGMVGATYNWAWSAVIVSVENQDEIASLDGGSAAQADTTRVHAESPADTTPQVIRGTWWMPTTNADQYIALHNPSLSPKTVNVDVADNQDALAVNGIVGSSIIQVKPTDGSEMLVDSWSFGTQTSLYNPPYYWSLALPIESGGYPGMAPLPPGSVFGGLTSLAALPGQNTAPPAEKVFTQHFIVQSPSSVGAGYYDPSYGVTYVNNCDFESKAVAGDAFQQSSTASTVNLAVRKPTGNCNITFTVIQTRGCHQTSYRLVLLYCLGFSHERSALWIA